jgi:sugar fermentation stimulation protein A
VSRLQQGRLIKRYKRFLADVELEGDGIVTAHCPNTGAMTGCAEPGSKVWLSKSDASTRKYPHTWELVETPAGMACVHSARANALAETAFRAGVIPGFDAYPDIRREVKYGTGSRADLLLEGPDGRVYVEVKSVTLCTKGGQGLFPDAVSDRGRKHLRELASVLDERTRAVMLYCALHSGINRVSAAGEIDPRYRDTLEEVMAAGVEVLAYAAAVTPQRLALTHALPFSVDPT